MSATIIIKSFKTYIIKTVPAQKSSINLNYIFLKYMTYPLYHKGD